MVGFGPEDDHFVVELTYNYGVGEYKLGNDFRVRNVSLNFLKKIKVCDCIFISPQGITLQSSNAVSNAKRLGWPLTEVAEALYLIHAPGGYPFYLVDKEKPSFGKCHGLFSVFISLFIWGGRDK